MAAALNDLNPPSSSQGLLCEWCIAALGGGYRLSGSGYGGKVEKEGDPGSVKDFLCRPKAP